MRTNAVNVTDIGGFVECVVYFNVTYNGVLSKQFDLLLLQMLTQVLNRICHSENTFNRIVVLRLPGEQLVLSFVVYLVNEAPK